MDYHQNISWSTKSWTIIRTKHVADYKNRGAEIYKISQKLQYKCIGSGFSVWNKSWISGNQDPIAHTQNTCFRRKILQKSVVSHADYM